MTNQEVRDALTNLAATSFSDIAPKILVFAASYTHLIERIHVAPNAHTIEDGGDEADPQFVADLERLQGISADLAATSVPEY